MRIHWMRANLVRLLWLLALAGFLSPLPAEQLHRAPPRSFGAELVRFAVIGDSGTGDRHQYAIAEQMEKWHARLPFDLVLMLGDNIYGGLFGWGGGDKDDFEKKFDRPYAKLLERGVVFRAALGNHDVKTRNGLDEVEAYERFHIERPEGYYSFTAGEFADGRPLLEFFVINTTRLEKDKHDPEQLAWLEEALAASRARWRIVYGHHPLYSAAEAHGSDVALRHKLEPILVGPDPDSPRVHVVLAGHDHLYQRFHPQKGIAYFVSGSGGKLRRGDARPSEWVAALEDQQRAFMLWEATPAELRFRAINEQGQPFDCGLLTGARPLEPVSCTALTAP